MVSSSGVQNPSWAELDDSDNEPITASLREGNFTPPWARRESEPISHATVKGLLSGTWWDSNGTSYEIDFSSWCCTRTCKDGYSQKHGLCWQKEQKIIKWGSKFTLFLCEMLTRPDKAVWHSHGSRGSGQRIWRRQRDSLQAMASHSRSCAYTADTAEENTAGAAVGSSAGISLGPSTRETAAAAAQTRLKPSTGRWADRRRGRWGGLRTSDRHKEDTSGHSESSADRSDIFSAAFEKPDVKTEDPQTAVLAAQRTALEERKARAIADEDFDMAKQLKEELGALQQQIAQHETRIALESLKARAIAAEDFDLAKRLKADLKSLERSPVASATERGREDSSIFGHGVYSTQCEDPYAAASASHSAHQQTPFPAGRMLGGASGGMTCVPSQQQSQQSAPYMQPATPAAGGTYYMPMLIPTGTLMQMCQGAYPSMNYPNVYNSGDAQSFNPSGHCSDLYPGGMQAACTMPGDMQCPPTLATQHGFSPFVHRGYRSNHSRTSSRNRELRLQDVRGYGSSSHSADRFCSSSVSSGHSGGACRSPGYASTTTDDAHDYASLSLITNGSQRKFSAGSLNDDNESFGTAASSRSRASRGRGRAHVPSSSRESSMRTDSEASSSIGTTSSKGVSHYTKVISQCTRKMQWQAALRHLAEFSGERLNPDMMVYSSVISACSKAGEVSTACQLLDEARGQGLQPSMTTCSEVLGASDRGGRWECALSVLHQMSQQGSSPTPPNLVHYSAAVSACARAGQSEQALKLLQTARENGLQPDVASYSTTIAACEKRNHWESAIDLLQQMKTYTVQPDEKALTAVIGACEKGGQCDRALQLFQEMQDRRLEADVQAYNKAIYACEKMGQGERALKLLQDMRRHNVTPSMVTYDAAISACAKGAQCNSAAKLLSEARSSNFEPSGVAYRSVIVACDRGGQGELALQTLQEMRQQRFTPDQASYNAAVSACVPEGRLSSALKLLAEMQDQKMEPDIHTLRSVTNMRGRGSLEDENVQQVVASRQSPSQLQREMWELGNSGQWELALTMLQQGRRKS